MASKSQLEIRKERLRFIKKTWQPTFTYIDVQRYADEFGVRLSTMHQYLKDLGLTYVTKGELERLNKMKTRRKYLKEVWSKQPDHSRETLTQLSDRFKTDNDTIKEDIEKIGLSHLLLSISERCDAKREEKFRTHEEIYRHYYDLYKKTGEKVTYIDISFEHKIDFGLVVREIKKLKLTEMITKSKPTCSYEERVAYYKPRAEYFRRFPDLTHTCKKLGLTPMQIYQELQALGILQSKSSVLNSLDNSIDDGYNENTLYLDSEVHNKGRFTYDEMNKVLGVSAGTYISDNYGY